MVFVLKGTGFTTNALISTDTITVGGAGTRHPQISVTADGQLPSTTIMVVSNLSAGKKDIIVNDGVPRTFPGAYEVTRVLRLSPARGYWAGGTTIFIEGWGFSDGPLLAIVVGGISTTKTPAISAITNGYFAVQVSLDLAIPGGGNTACRVDISDSGGVNQFVTLDNADDFKEQLKGFVGM